MSETRTEAPAAVETPVVAPAEAAPSPVETPAVAAPDAPPQPTEQGPATEGTATPEPAVETPAEPTSLLGETPAEAPPAGPAPIAYEPFTLPEGMSPDQERMTAFTELIGEHKLSQEAAQKLIDIYAADRQNLHEAVERHQRDTFAEMNQKAVQEFEADPQIGLNRRDTTLNNARSAIRTLFTGRDGTVNEQHLGEFWNVLAFSGAGNYLPVIRAFDNAHRLLSERPAPPMPAGAPAPRANGHDAPDRRYPNMPNRTP